VGEYTDILSVGIEFFVSFILGKENYLVLQFYRRKCRLKLYCQYTVNSPVLLAMPMDKYYRRQDLLDIQAITAKLN
jgi:hypothetical protein